MQCSEHTLLQLTVLCFWQLLHYHFQLGSCAHVCSCTTVKTIYSPAALHPCQLGLSSFHLLGHQLHQLQAHVTLMLTMQAAACLEQATLVASLSCPSCCTRCCDRDAHHPSHHHLLNGFHRLQLPIADDFVEDWNGRKLSAKYYAGLTGGSAMRRSKHQWGIRQGWDSLFHLLPNICSPASAPHPTPGLHQ